MKIGTILFGTSCGSRAAVSEERLWARAGLEPSTTELLSDPIALLLMRADRLETSEIQMLLHQARGRRSGAAERRERARQTAPVQAA